MVLLLFGDHCSDFHPSIAELYRQSKSSAVLRLFLLACSESVQRSVSALCAGERAYFGSFDGLLELAEADSRRRDEERDVCVATVLQCACQLGWLLMLVVPRPQRHIPQAAARRRGRTKS